MDWLAECRVRVEIWPAPWTGRSTAGGLAWFLEQSKARLGRVEERRGSRYYSGGKSTPGDKRWSEIYLSIQAEAVAAVLLNLEPDFDLMLKGDPGYDFVGATALIDIKATSHKTGRVIVYERPLRAILDKHAPSPLIIVQATMQSRGEICLTGWIPADEAIRVADRGSTNGDPVLWVPQGRLRKMSTDFT